YHLVLSRSAKQLSHPVYQLLDRKLFEWPSAFHWQSPWLVLFFLVLVGHTRARGLMLLLCFWLLEYRWITLFLLFLDQCIDLVFVVAMMFQMFVLFHLIHQRSIDHLDSFIFTSLLLLM